MERGNRYVNVKEERNKEIVFSIDGRGTGEEKSHVWHFQKLAATVPTTPWEVLARWLEEVPQSELGLR